jgi:uncharacterized protein YdeI (YjbR/CyaY-like superfamily)
MSDHGRIEITTRAQWRAWLEAHHRDEAGIWVVTHKKAAGFPRSAKRASLVWISGAKRPETRVRETVERSARGERADRPQARPGRV